MTQLMVGPFNIPKRMTKTQLEWWILFGICVAGKSARQTEAKLEALLIDMRKQSVPGMPNAYTESFTPFGCVRTAVAYGKLGYFLRKHRLGKYKLFNRAFRAAVNIDLDNITVESLEKVPGIGPKTARMTVMYGLSNSNVAVLDTHILKFLRSLGYDAPKSTPTGKRYLELERAFLVEAKKRKISPTQLDTEIWKNYADQSERKNVRPMART